MIPSTWSSSDWTAPFAGNSSMGTSHRECGPRNVVFNGEFVVMWIASIATLSLRSSPGPKPTQGVLTFLAVRFLERAITKTLHETDWVEQSTGAPAGRRGRECAHLARPRVFALSHFRHRAKCQPLIGLECPSSLPYLSLISHPVNNGCRLK